MLPAQRASLDVSDTRARRCDAAVGLSLVMASVIVLPASRSTGPVRHRRVALLSSGYASWMGEKIEPSKVLRNADSDERSEIAQADNDHDQRDAALARLEPEHVEAPTTDPEQDLAEWRARVDPQRSGR